jgi:hypothetical protein
MVTVHPKRIPITESNLHAFFHASLDQAIRNQRVDAGDATVWYLTNLLADFSRTERLFEQTAEGRLLTPLAELYGVAMEASTEVERKLVLRRLGDIALFVAGLFSGLFTRRRRAVDVDYYIAMGGSAYAYLCESSQGAVRDHAVVAIFHQLSGQFARFVDVLGEVGENAFGANAYDPLRLHELWCKTGSPRLERKLRAAGITPVKASVAH